VPTAKTLGPESLMLICGAAHVAVETSGMPLARRKDAWAYLKVAIGVLLFDDETECLFDIDEKLAGFRSLVLGSSVSTSPRRSSDHNTMFRATHRAKACVSDSAGR
jgi:hypothetical protein